MADRPSRPVILLTGANGQLGWEMQRHARAKACALNALDRHALDVTDPEAVNEGVARFRPEVIINAAAYTDVDRAEQESESAFAVNRNGAANMAAAAKEHGARLIHISTDFVFDGARNSPYKPDDEPHPESVYGASKHAGEAAVQEILAHQALILRAAWVYSSHGNNFVKTMLRLLRERDALRVVDDQVGSPTWAKGLADCVWRVIDNPLTGIRHWTDAGVASWYDLAVAIQEEALNLGLLTRQIPIHPIPTSEYPTPAKRPSYSVLDKSTTWQSLDLVAPHWRESLRSMLEEVRREA